LSRNVSPAIFPRGVRSSPECCEPRLRPLVPSPARPLQEGTVPIQDHAGLPLVGFLLPRTHASLELPYRAFPSRGAAPALAGRCFLAGSLSDHRQRSACGDFTTAFTGSRQPFATRARPKTDPGLMSQDDGSLRSLVRPPRHTGVCRTYRPVPTDTGLAGEWPARPLRSLAPPGSPFSDDPNSWPAWNRPSVLSWGSFTLQSLLHHGSGFGHSRRHARGA